MDPNATLANIREILSTYWAGPSEPELVDRLAELTGDLDEWLTNGGFYPDAWQPQSTWERDTRYRPQPGETLEDGSPVPADYDPETDCHICGRKYGH